MPDRPSLAPLFEPRSVVFVGGSNLEPALRYHRDEGFAGRTYVVNPTRAQIGGIATVPSIEALPEAPDLAFVAIRREAAVEAIAALREAGCRAVVCNAAGFAETGPEGAALQARLVEAAGGMALLGPNAIGLANFLRPMAAMMNHFGAAHVERGAAIVSQSGGLLCDMVFADRGLAITHLVGCGNQAVTGAVDCALHLIGVEGVAAVGIAFEGLGDLAGLRRAAVKAQEAGKPLVALKFARTEAGREAAKTHTASMTGEARAWDALLDRLGIVSTHAPAEFIETLKLAVHGFPRGRRAMAATVSGASGILLADHLTAGGIALPQPSAEGAAALRALLPEIATPANPMDVTMAAWNDRARQEAIYGALMDDLAREAPLDAAIMIQNYPREGMWEIGEYAAQAEAIAAAAGPRGVTAIECATLAECMPEEARARAAALGIVPLQGLGETVAALAHAAHWHERRAAIAAEGAWTLAAAPPARSRGATVDEASAKARLRAAGVPVPDGIACPPGKAADAARRLGFPVAVKALEPALLHKTEAGAVALGLGDGEAVAEAVAAMAGRLAASGHGTLSRVLVETMAGEAVAEVMASVTHDEATGPLMVIAGGGVAAELWEDTTLLAAPFTRAEIARALDRLKTARLIAGWRGGPPGDRAALLDALEALGTLGLAADIAEIEVNPIRVGRAGHGVAAVDAVLTLIGARGEALRFADAIAEAG